MSRAQEAQERPPGRTCRRPPPAAIGAPRHRRRVGAAPDRRRPTCAPCRRSALIASCAAAVPTHCLCRGRHQPGRRATAPCSRPCCTRAAAGGCATTGRWTGCCRVPATASRNHALLVLGLVQLAVLGLPPHAAVAATVEAARAMRRPQHANLVNACCGAGCVKAPRAAPALDADDGHAPRAAALAGRGTAGGATPPKPCWQPTTWSLTLVLLRQSGVAPRRRALAARWRGAGAWKSTPAASARCPESAAQHRRDAPAGLCRGRVLRAGTAAQLAADLLDLAPPACSTPARRPAAKAAHMLEAPRWNFWRWTPTRGPPRVHENLARLGLVATVRAGDAAQPRDWWDAVPSRASCSMRPAAPAASCAVSPTCACTAGPATWTRWVPPRPVARRPVAAAPRRSLGLRHLLGVQSRERRADRCFPFPPRRRPCLPAGRAGVVRSPRRRGPAEPARRRGMDGFFMRWWTSVPRVPLPAAGTGARRVQCGSRRAAAGHRSGPPGRRGDGLWLVADCRWQPSAAMLDGLDHARRPDPRRRRRGAGHQAGWARGARRRRGATAWSCASSAHAKCTSGATWRADRCQFRRAFGRAFIAGTPGASLDIPARDTATRWTLRGPGPEACPALLPCRWHSCGRSGVRRPPCTAGPGSAG